MNSYDLTIHAADLRVGDWYGSLPIESVESQGVTVRVTDELGRTRTIDRYQLVTISRDVRRDEAHTQIMRSKR